MPITAKEMVKLLKKHGFTKKSQNGTSHMKLYRESTNTTIIVPQHAKELGKGLERAILKQAGINKH